MVRPLEKIPEPPTPNHYHTCTQKSCPGLEKRLKSWEHSLLLQRTQFPAPTHSSSQLSNSSSGNPNTMPSSNLCENQARMCCTDTSKQSTCTYKIVSLHKAVQKEPQSQEKPAGYRHLLKGSEQGRARPALQEPCVKVCCWVLRAGDSEGLAPALGSSHTTGSQGQAAQTLVFLHVLELFFSPTDDSSNLTKTAPTEAQGLSEGGPTT